MNDILSTKCNHTIELQDIGTTGHQYQYDIRAQLQSACLKDMQLQEDAKIFAILRGFPFSNTISVGHWGPPPQPKPRHNIWLRQHYLKKFKQSIGTSN